MGTKVRHTFVVSYLTDLEGAAEIDEQFRLFQALGKALKENGVDRFVVAMEETISDKMLRRANDLLPSEADIRNAIEDFFSSNECKKNEGIYYVAIFQASGISIGISREDHSDEDPSMSDVYIFNLFLPECYGEEYVNVSGMYKRDEVTSGEAVKAILDAWGTIDLSKLYLAKVGTLARNNK